jgi:hypothetical protein
MVGLMKLFRSKEYKALLELNREQRAKQYALIQHKAWSMERATWVCEDCPEKLFDIAERIYEWTYGEKLDL